MGSPTRLDSAGADGDRADGGRLGRGFQHAIDDFGAGYSSLGYLQHLPVDAIKIDQSFVIPLVVGSAAQMGHKLGFEVVAEVVESQDALRRVTELGCDIAQGHFVSHPMAADQFGAWRAASQRPGRWVPRFHAARM
nr:EAL domain-containing protein [Aromatoleum diolicum]